jgi:uncharacterized HAD superfamily protein
MSKAIIKVIKKVCIDIDNTIAKPKVNYIEEMFLPENSKQLEKIYEDCELIEGAKEGIKKLIDSYYIIYLYTAREKKYARVTLDWLYNNKVPYHKVFFDKVRADYYIDDKAIRFTNWKDINLKD